MNVLYLLVLLALIAVLLLRLPTAMRSRESMMTWIASLLACLAILTLGPVIPIVDIDRELGGSNDAWLAQCLLATFAFWAFAEAVKSSNGAQPVRRSPVLIPIAWCTAFTIPFLIARRAAPAEVHFSRVHADDLGVYLSALIYMAGLCWIVRGIMLASAGKCELGRRLFWFGGLGILIGCTSEALVMTIDHFNVLPVDWRSSWYLGFEVTFYPGVILIASGMAYYSIRRRLRSRSISRRVDLLRSILVINGVPQDPVAPRDRADIFAVYSLLIRINDLRNLGDLTLTDKQARVVAASETWVENDLPLLHESAGELESQK